MLAALNRKRKQLTNKKGMTLTEVIIVVAILAIVLTFVVINVIRLVIQAYMTRANDTAEVIYMALQTSITDLKAQGTFDEAFAESKRGDITSPTSEDQYYTVPDIAIDGGTVGSYTIPGVTNAEGTLMSAGTADEQARIAKLKANGDLVYMRLFADDTKGDDSQLLKDLLSPYITDLSILEYSILVEVNLENKTVRCAFYTERADLLSYGEVEPVEEGTLTEAMLESGENVLLRERQERHDKRQGYHGSLGIGEPENLGLLDNAYVKVNNDDMLAIEWGEIGPVGGDGVISEEDRKLFTGMTYNLRIVNANDTNTVYYEIPDITAYNDDTYLTTSNSTTGVIGKGSTRPIPVYDMYNYDHVSNALNIGNMVEIPTIEYRLQSDGTRTPVSIPNFKHRLSYYVPADKSGVKQYGMFRLILDSITEEGSPLVSEFSIREAYPEIPWNENFKVTVEGKYQGEGFTGSFNVSAGEDNGYVAKKAINPQEDLYFDGKRGSTFIEELENYLANRTVTPRSNMWYEVGYSRHLNNMRYIIGEEEAAKLGHAQNFLLVDDIDWSVQKLGPLDVAGERLHRLVVSNAGEAAGADRLTNANGRNAVNLQTFHAVSANDKTGAVDGKTFEGKFLSTAKRDSAGDIIHLKDDADIDIQFEDPSSPGDFYKLPAYNTFNIAHLKLANNSTGIHAAKADKNVGLFDKVGKNGYIRDINIHGVTAQGTDYVGAIAGEFEGYVQNVTVLKNETDNHHKTINGAGTAEDIRSGTLIRPWDYPGASPYTGNMIVATNEYAGGVAGLLSKGTGNPSPNDGLHGTAFDIANGNRLVDLYAGPIDSAQNQPVTPTANANPNVLQGIAVQAASYAGGLFGSASEGTVITKVANTAAVEATADYAGGIVGELGEKAVINGLDEAATGSAVRLKRTYVYGPNFGDNKPFTAEYNNYGFIKAASYAGGIAGVVHGGNTVSNPGDPVTAIKNVKNTGAIHATTEHAAGIVALISEDSHSVAITNVTNKADVVVIAGTGTVTGDYAGGILGSTANGTKDIVIQGASNEKTQTGRPAIGFPSAISSADSGIIANSYVGGIIGFGQEDLKLRQYQATADIGDVIEEEDIFKLENTARITARPNGVVGGSYAGGFAGALIEEVELNNENPKKVPYTVDLLEIAIKNEGVIQANNYAGGAVGAAAGKVIIRNIENELGANVTAAGTVLAPNATGVAAGGIIGATGSEQSTAINATGSTQAEVDFTNDIFLATNPVTADTYYTNRAAINANYNAGGIIGYAETNHAQEIKNVFNQGNVTARADNAGGIFGWATAETKLMYNDDGSAKTMLNIRLTTTTQNLLTNIGTIRANGLNAGGIVGLVDSTDVEIHDAFNGSPIPPAPAATVSAGNANAGGIIGNIAVNNNAILQYDYENIVKTIVVPPVGTAGRYTNTANVTAGNDNAGGIVGVSAIGLENVFNRGVVRTTAGSNAGGIVGRLEFGSIVLSVKMTDEIAERVIDKAAIPLEAMYSNVGQVTAFHHFAGGIVGRGSKVNIENQFNAAAISTDRKSVV